MIALLRGLVASRAESHIVVDVQGVGYGVYVPATLAEELALGEEVQLHIHTHVRDDAIQLFGFADQLGREIFLALTTVTGIGPKLALGILSGTAISDLLRAVTEGDVKRLTTLKGIGKKTAQRILVELKEVFARISPATVPARPSATGAFGRFDDVASALQNLGFRAADVERAISALQADPEAPSDFEGLFRMAMQLLR